MDSRAKHPLDVRWPPRRPTRRPTLFARLLTVVLAVGFGGAQGGEIAELYAQLANPPAIEAPPPQGEEVLRPPAERPPATDILRIGLERVAGYAGGPAYWVIIGSGGDFQYVGVANVERIGVHTGSVPEGSLAMLLAYVVQIEFRQLEDAYTSRYLDIPSTYVMAEWPEETKVILTQAFGGPPRLWAYARLIEDLLEEATWDEPQ